MTTFIQPNFPLLSLPKTLICFRWICKKSTSKRFVYRLDFICLYSPMRIYLSLDLINLYLQEIDKQTIHQVLFFISLYSPMRIYRSLEALFHHVLCSDAKPLADCFGSGVEHHALHLV
ncbi:hypothetical protein L1987_33325 [Smallanthus sonchifolius]|uniref:Uncharacterized protein n=1 Tax=Smallanthus sonchifolius TaxID=185202 RepID=A0ACB9HTB8_9ASTR|nr:hypothetical protein L1987_33325 [Smallanthus sonchifolius]